MPGYIRMLDGQEYCAGEACPPIECLRCGICCTRYQPPLSPEELDTLAGKLGMSPDSFLAEYVQTTLAGYLLRQTEKGCVFLDRETEELTAACRIHPFRPEACQSWAPSLSRPECREGLIQLQARDSIMLSEEF